MWRVIGTVSILLAATAPVPASDPPREERTCLSHGDTAEIVAARRVIAPGQAVTAARGAVPDGDIMRASLCRKADALVYRMTAIRPDGRVVRVTVDAPSGKVQAVH